MKRYGDEQKAVIWLNMAVGLTSAKINRLKEIAPASELIKNFRRYKRAAEEIAGEAVNKLEYAYDEKVINDLLDTLGRSRAEVIIREDPEYSEALNAIPCPPAVLYCKGDIGLMSTRIIGVVGSRDPSRYGAEVTAAYAGILAKAGLTIASGLARGIDSIAHRAALDAGGKTIAVLGCGIDKVYPADNRQLYKLIEDEGLIISEYAPGVAASGYHFPERNRIISGVSSGVVVTEAGLKSGSLITADCAIEQGRAVYVVPSNITSKRGAGSNRLIKKFQTMITLSPDDILEDMGLQQEKIETSAMQLDFTEAKTLEALSYGELHFDELREVTGLGVSALNALLTKMELLGTIKKLDNNYYGI